MHGKINHVSATLDLQTILEKVSLRAYDVTGTCLKCLSHNHQLKWPLHRVFSYICVARFYKTDPIRTSRKIKLTPPVDSFIIIWLVLTLSATQLGLTDG